MGCNWSKARNFYTHKTMTDIIESASADLAKLAHDTLSLDSRQLTYTDVFPLLIALMKAAKKLQGFSGGDKKEAVKGAMRLLVTDAVPGDQPLIESFVADIADQAIDAIYFISVNRVSFKDKCGCFHSANNSK